VATPGHAPIQVEDRGPSTCDGKKQVYFIGIDPTAVKHFLLFKPLDAG